MDPKFGEISRAMRNRGVEVYIPGEVNGNSFVMEVVLVLTCYTTVQCIHPISVKHHLRSLGKYIDICYIHLRSFGKYIDICYIHLRS